MFQNVMSCSISQGLFWCGAIVTLTNKRLLIEWQNNKDKNIILPYEQIAEWKISKKIRGIAGILLKGKLCIDVQVNEILNVLIFNKKSIMDILINQLNEYCIEKYTDEESKV